MNNTKLIVLFLFTVVVSSIKAQDNLNSILGKGIKLKPNANSTIVFHFGTHGHDICKRILVLMM